MLSARMLGKLWRTGVLALVCILMLPLASPLAGAAPTPQRGTPFHLLEATIDGIHAAMRSGDLTCRQLVGLYLNRIEAYNREGPALNAIQTVNPRALDEAERLDAQLRTSGPAGPLHCIPVLVKDQVEVRDMPTTYGSALFRDFVPDRDATAVERIKAAGGIVLAKTTMGEFAAWFAGSGFGVCRNPYDPERDPGGSSCGSGVGVSANLGMLAIGEDTWGSIREPAARTSLVALRPTVPLVSRFGMLPGTPSQDTLGPMARTVRDTALMLAATAGPDDRVPISLDEPGSVFEHAADGGVRGLRVAWSPGLGVGRVDPEVARIVEAACRRFEAAGCSVDAAQPEIGEIGPMIATYRALGAAAGSPDLLDRADEVDNPLLREFLKRPRELTGLQIAQAGIDHARYLERMATFFRQYDLLVTPATPTAAYMLDQMYPPEIDGEPVANALDAMLLTYAFTMAGLPAISVPAGLTSSGLPVGMQIVGGRHAEAQVLRAAAAFEQLAPWADLRPPVAASG
jgi:amidase